MGNKKFHLLLIAVLVLLTDIAVAGEFSCGISGCRIDGIMPEVNWKPTGCYEPTKPFAIYASTVEDYNNAVESFNFWLQQVRGYMQCIKLEAVTDAKRAPELILEDAKKRLQEISNEVSNERTQLEIMRPR